MKKITILVAFLSVIISACGGGSGSGGGGWDVSGIPNVRVSIKDDAAVSSVNKSITYVDGELHADAMFFTYVSIKGYDDRYPGYEWCPTWPTSIGDAMLPGEEVLFPTGYATYGRVMKYFDDNGDYNPVSPLVQEVAENGAFHLDTVDVTTHVPLPINGWDEATHAPTGADKPEFYGVEGDAIQNALRHAASSELEFGTTGNIIGARPTTDPWWFDQLDVSRYGEGGGHHTGQITVKPSFYDAFDYSNSRPGAYTNAARVWRVMFSDTGDVSDFKSSYRIGRGDAPLTTLSITYRKDQTRVLTAWADRDPIFDENHMSVLDLRTLETGSVIFHVAGEGRVTWADLTDRERADIVRVFGVLSNEVSFQIEQKIVRLMNMSALVPDGRSFAVIAASDASIDEAAYSPILPNTTVDIRMRIPQFGGRKVEFDEWGWDEGDDWGNPPTLKRREAVVMNYGIGENHVPLDFSLAFIPKIEDPAE